jgi:hypothetical protein
MSGPAKRSLYIGLTVILLALVAILAGVQTTLAIVILVVVVFLPLGLAWRFAPVPKNNRRLTWNQSIAIIVATLILGNGLTILWPLWLAPPSLSLTPYVYLVLAAAWFPITLICLLLGPAGRVSFGLVFLLLIFGFTLCIISLALGGPGFVSFDAIDCQQATTETGQIRYTCKHTSTFGVASTTDQAVFEGPTWLPFVRLVSRHHQDNPD